MIRATSDFMYLGDKDCDQVAALLADVEIRDALHVSVRPDWTYALNDNGELVRDEDGLAVIVDQPRSIRLSFQCRISGRLGLAEFSVPREMLSDLGPPLAKLIRDLAESAVQHLREDRVRPSVGAATLPR